MKILVTGSTGFIGGNLVEVLASSGHDVIATGRCVEKVKQYGWFEKVKFITYDLNECNAGIYDYFTRPDLVIHTAWDHLPDYHDKRHADSNLGNSIRFIGNMIGGGLENIAVTGTCFEYGLKEGCVNENDQCYPVTEYARAKLKLLQYMQELNDMTHFAYKWIRLFYILGNNDPKRSVFAKLENAARDNEKYFKMSKGDQVRDYLPVVKACRYIAKISLQNNITGIINCCSGKPVKLKKIIADHIKENGLKIKLKTVMPYSVYEPKKVWGYTGKLFKIIWE